MNSNGRQGQLRGHADTAIAGSFPLGARFRGYFDLLQPIHALLRLILLAWSPTRFFLSAALPTGTAQAGHSRHAKLPAWTQNSSSTVPAWVHKQLSRAWRSPSGVTEDPGIPDRTTTQKYLHIDVDASSTAMIRRCILFISGPDIPKLDTSPRHRVASSVDSSAFAIPDFGSVRASTCCGLFSPVDDPCLVPTKFQRT